MKRKQPSLEQKLKDREHIIATQKEDILRLKLDVESWKRRSMANRDKIESLLQSDKFKLIGQLKDRLAEECETKEGFQAGLKMIQSLDDACNYGNGKAGFEICGGIATLFLERKFHRGQDKKSEE